MPAALALAAALACAAPATQELVALWESPTSRGGLGSAIEFRSDGSFTEATTVIVNAGYRIQGGELILLAPAGTAPNQPAEQSRGRIRFDRGRLVVSGTQTLVLERVAGSAGGDDVVGVWRYRHPTGAIAFERYTPDGGMFLRIPMRNTIGCYTLDGGNIALVAVRELKGQYSVDAAANALTLTIVDQPVMTFQRQTLGPWYDRDRIDVQLPPR